MPELPEIEHLRRSLMPHLVGARVERAQLRRRDVLTVVTKCDRSVRRSLLEGATIDRLERRGKQLAIIARDDRALCVHLGMSGQLQWYEPEARTKPTDHVHARWTITTDTLERGELIFRDPRRFGGLWSFADVHDLLNLRWRELGPDALNTPRPALRERLGDVLARTNRTLKAVLLDQSVLAGIGNIYADEICHRARVHPASSARAVLATGDLDRLAASIHEILDAAVDAGGSTLRDYVDADGQSGRAALLHRVYGRGGRPCLTCGGSLQQAVLAQRTTTWCSQCQPRMTDGIRPRVVHKSFPMTVEKRPTGRARVKGISD